MANKQTKKQIFFPPEDDEREMMISASLDQSLSNGKEGD